MQSWHIYIHFVTNVKSHPFVCCGKVWNRREDQSFGAAWDVLRKRQLIQTPDLLGRQVPGRIIEFVRALGYTDATSDERPHKIAGRISLEGR